MNQATYPSSLQVYARIRQILGVGSMICNLMLVWGLFLLSRGDGSYRPRPEWIDLLWLIPGVFALLFLVNLPLDWAAGYLLEKKAGRFVESAGVWFKQWLSGVAGYGLLQTLGGYLFALWFFSDGFAPAMVILIPGIVAGVRIWQFYLIPGDLRQEGVWPKGYEEKLRTELKKLKEPWPRDLYLYRSEDGATLNGGRVGMGNHSRLMISDASPRVLSPRELAILITREERYLAWSAGQKHFHWSLGWGLLGVLAMIPGISFLGLSGFSSWLWILAALTTWHGLGLILLPGIARRQILKADRQVVAGEVSKREYANLLKKLQAANRTPIRSNRVAEILFYSMPSLETRLQRLETP